MFELCDGNTGHQNLRAIDRARLRHAKTVRTKSSDSSLVAARADSRMASRCGDERRDHTGACFSLRAADCNYRYIPPLLVVHVVSGDAGEHPHAVTPSAHTHSMQVSQSLPLSAQPGPFPQLVVNTTRTNLMKKGFVSDSLVGRPPSFQGSYILAVVRLYKFSKFAQKPSAGFLLERLHRPSRGGLQSFPRPTLQWPKYLTSPLNSFGNPARASHGTLVPAQQAPIAWNAIPERKQFGSPITVRVGYCRRTRHHHYYCCYSLTHART